MTDLAPPPDEGYTDLPNGCTLYWKMTEQGREYYSDECGAVFSVWHTAIVDEGTLLAAIVQEKKFQRLEHEFIMRESRDRFEKTMAEITDELTEINKR